VEGTVTPLEAALAERRTAEFQLLLRSCPPRTRIAVAVQMLCEDVGARLIAREVNLVRAGKSLTVTFQIPEEDPKVGDSNTTSTEGDP
jgi:hypothetical protein